MQSKRKSGFGKSNATKKRTHNTRRIKRNATYFTHEICDLFNVSKGTVLNWIRKGLVTIPETRPYLIHGSDLIDFLKNRQSNRKSKCQLNEMLCCKCKAPRPAWGNLADLKPLRGNRAKLIAICTVCETQMHRIISPKKLPSFEKVLLIQTLGKERLSDSPQPNVNYHFKDKKNETQV